MQLGGNAVGRAEACAEAPGSETCARISAAAAMSSDTNSAAVGHLGAFWEAAVMAAGTSFEYWHRTGSGPVLPNVFLWRRGRPAVHW